MGHNPLGKREEPGTPRVITYTSPLLKVTIKDPKMLRVHESQIWGQRNSAILSCNHRETRPATSRAREVSLLTSKGLHRREVTCVRVMPIHKSVTSLTTPAGMRIIRCFMKLSAPKYSINKSRASPRTLRVLTGPL